MAENGTGGREDGLDGLDGDADNIGFLPPAALKPLLARAGKDWHNLHPKARLVLRGEYFILWETGRWLWHKRWMTFVFADGYTETVRHHNG